MIKVSVILPVYGVADYIEKCTASLLEQTLQEMEFLFVDDHGPDNSIELVQKMIADHPRRDQFHFLRPEHNLGAGMARNYAIPHAQGEYIAFVDSDDWVEPTMFESLYEQALRYDGADLCYCQMLKDYAGKQPSEVMKNPEIVSGKLSKATKSYFLTHYVSMFSTYIYRREFVVQHSIAFPESRSADDSFFITSALVFATSMAHVDKPFYHYMIRPGSVTTTKDSTKYLKRLETFRSLMAYLKEQGAYEENKQEIDFIYLKKGYISSVFNYLYNSSEPKKATVLSIRQEMLSQVPGYASNIYYRQTTSLKVLDFMLSECTAVAIWLLPLYLKHAKPIV
ncbi:MAG: glycosyltransferase [Bacteroidales bacterium]|nr:glycosyltransferase [Bacteroidales bacterium]